MKCEHLKTVTDDRGTKICVLCGHEFVRRITRATDTITVIAPGGRTLTPPGYGIRHSVDSPEETFRVLAGLIADGYAWEEIYWEDQTIPENDATSAPVVQWDDHAKVWVNV